VSSRVVSGMEAVIEKTSAGLVLFHYPKDTHQDHRAVAACAVSATRHTRNILTYETPTSIDFNPGVFVDIENFIEKKEQMLRVHTSQLERNGSHRKSFLESARIVAAFRGLQGKIPYAEAFAARRMLLENL